MAGTDISSVQPDTTQRFVSVSIFALGVSCVMTQLALMRELLGAFSGNELVLGVVLGNWLLLMGAGASLGRWAERLQHPVDGLVLMQILVAILPMGQVFAVRALRNVVFVRGSEVGVTGTVLSTLVLLAPYCLVAGFMLALACSIFFRGGFASGAGRVYVADSLGSIAGGVLFSFVLVRWLDHIALLAVPAILNLAAAAWLCRAGRQSFPSISVTNPLRWEISILALIVGIPAILWLGSTDAVSTSLQFPGQNILFRANSPYGRLVVTESSGQTSFIENGIPIISTPNVEQVEEAAHYAMSQRPDARRVLLVSGGVAGVAKEILKYNVSGVDCVELDPLIVKAGRQFLPENLASPRIHVVTTDGRRFIRQTTNRYDVVILALPDPSTAQLNRFFTTEFFSEVKRVLSPDGVLSLAVGVYENFVSPELERMLATTRGTLAHSFANVLLVPGGRVYFLASDGSLHLNIAARLEAAGIQTKLVNGHYLDAMLAPDRLDDVEHAAAQSDGLNRDFRPVLYFQCLRHWMSQFESRPATAGLTGALLVGVGLYAMRLRAASFALFASGFAASALEVVLLLALQVLCGSLYRQMGVVVTLFMAGLAVGAALANRPGAGFQSGSIGSTTREQARHLRGLAFAIGILAALLPLLLPLLSSLSRTGVGNLGVQIVINLLAFALAALVSAQFPLANRMEFDRIPRCGMAASRLYTADFVGAFLGALLASTLLIPLVGVTGVCLLTAALNALAGGVLFWRKVST